MSRNFIPDESLIDQLRLNNTAAFEELYHRYWFSLYSYAFEKTGDSAAARKVVKEIFINFWEFRHSYPIDFSVSMHFYTAVRKFVVRSINERLENRFDLEDVEKKIIPGFAVTNLNNARKPVKVAERNAEKVASSVSWWNNSESSFSLAGIRQYFEKALNIL